VKLNLKNIAIVLSSAWVVGSVVGSVAHAAETAKYQPGEVIVKYKDGTTRTFAEMNSIYNSVGVKKVRRFTGTMVGFERLYFNENQSVEEMVKTLNQDPNVEYAQPNFIVSAFPIRQSETAQAAPFGEACIFPGVQFPPGCDPSAPVKCFIPGIPFPPGCDDAGGGGSEDGVVMCKDEAGKKAGSRPSVPSAPSDTAAPDTKADCTYGLKLTQATDAVKEFAGSKSMIVADIDTGIDYTHEDLIGNLWRNPNPTQGDEVGYDFVHNDGLPFDDNEHGTHTAGTIGAVGNNGKGVSGVNQVVSIMALKFLSGEGSGTTADAIRAIDYAVEHGAKVLSNSWGGPAESDEENKSLSDAIDRAGKKGVLFIAAAGNGNMFGMAEDIDSNPTYPAAFENDNLITVAAIDWKDRLGSFSNYGKKHVHLAAPGVKVYSTVPGNGYMKFDGTSMACPHVAGAAALVWAKHPEWDYKKVKAVLLDTSDKLDILKDKTVSGGRLNVLKALQAQ
jgi:hypothetical protein